MAAAVQTRRCPGAWLATDARGSPSLLDLARMERDLSRLLDGRKVDLRTPNELSRYFRDEVLSTASVQYAEG